MIGARAEDRACGFDNIHARFNLPPRRIIRRHEHEGRVEGGGRRMRVIGRKWFTLLTVDGWRVV